MCNFVCIYWILDLFLALSPHFTVPHGENLSVETCSSWSWLAVVVSCWQMYALAIDIYFFPRMPLLANVVSGICADRAFRDEMINVPRRV